MFWERAIDRQHTHEVRQSYSASRGVIEEIYFPKRDTVVCPFPSFLTTARFDKGMSGGPVLGPSGNVIGVICSSVLSTEGAITFLDEQGYISFVSLIGPALFLQLDAAGCDKVVRKQFLYDFVTGGNVVLDETVRTLMVHRSDNELAPSILGAPPR